MSALERMYLEFLFMAYTAVWIIMFGFLYRMMGRARRLERDIQLLRENWGEGAAESAPARADAPIQGPSV